MQRQVDKMDNENKKERKYSYREERDEYESKTIIFAKTHGNTNMILKDNDEDKIVGISYDGYKSLTIDEEELLGEDTKKIIEEMQKPIIPDYIYCYKVRQFYMYNKLTSCRCRITGKTFHIDNTKGDGVNYSAPSSKCTYIEFDSLEGLHEINDVDWLGNLMNAEQEYHKLKDLIWTHY